MIEVRMSIRRLAQSPMMRVGFAAVLVLPLAACCMRGNRPASAPQPVATPPATLETPAQPAAPPQPGAIGPTAPGETIERPQTAPAATETAPPGEEPVSPPTPAEHVPPPETAAKPTAQATLPKPAAAPGSPVGVPAPKAATKATVPAPSQPTPGARAPNHGTAPPPTTHKNELPAGKTPALDLNSLKQELKDTKAIGIFTKITLKNQMDDLLDWFREYHGRKGKRSLTDLGRSYDLLVMKLLSLVQDEDQKLAADILSSREAIWDLLADATTFATLQL